MPVRSPAVARQGTGELDTVPMRAGPGGCRAWSRPGTRPGRLQQLPRSAPADGVLRTAARPRAPAAHRQGDRAGSSALSAPATTARATATAAGRSGAATPTTQMTSSAVCALTTLAFMLDAARLAATAKAAGSAGWPSSLATRTVTSYLQGGLFMPGTVSVVCDIFGARLPLPAHAVRLRLPSHGKPSAAPPRWSSSAARAHAPTGILHRYLGHIDTASKAHLRDARPAGPSNARRMRETCTKER